MRVFLSRHRITYTPVGGVAVDLLAPLDMEDAEPRFEGGAEVQKDALLQAVWAAHKGGRTVLHDGGLPGHPDGRPRIVPGVAQFKPLQNGK